MFEEKKKMIGRVEKIYFANGVKMKMIKDADGNVRTEIVDQVKPVVVPVAVIEPEPMVAVEPEPMVENEDAVQAEGNQEGDAEEGAPVDEQRHSRGRRKLSR